MKTKRSIKKYPDGGKVDKDAFSYDRWRRTLPENLQLESPNYNLRGWWESLGRPEKFEPFNYESYGGENDGPNGEFMYHGSSRNPYTGETLKGKMHSTFYTGLNEDREAGYSTITKDRKAFTLDEFSNGGTINNNMKKRSLKKYTDAGVVTSPDYMAQLKGGALPMSTMGVNMIAEAIPQKSYTDEFGNTQQRTSIGAGTLGGAAKGAQMGMVAGPYGAAIGATLGGAYGLIKGINDKNEAELQEKKFGINQANKEAFNKANTLKQYNDNVNTGNAMMFQDGGMVIQDDMMNPNAELELQETFQTPDGQVGMVDGPSHEQGGIEVALPEGTRVFSDKLKHNGRTFAKLTAPITKKINKLESDNPDRFKTNTINLLNQQLDYYFNLQEENKAQQEMKKRSLKMRKGGLIKYSGTPGTPSTILDNPNYTPLFMESARNVVIPYNTDYTPMFMESARNPVASSINSNQPKPLNFWGADVDQNNQMLNIAESLQPSMVETTSVNQPTLDYPTPTPTPTTKASNQWFDPKNVGQYGQVGSALANNMIQSRRINRTPAPRSLAPVSTASTMAGPQGVNYSANLNDIDRATKGDFADVQRSFGNSATARAFKNKVRLNQLQQKGQVFQNQENTNRQIQNQFIGQRNEAMAKDIMTNAEIAQMNMENQYNYNLWKTGAKNRATADMFGTSGQVFGNMTNYQNQLEQANIMANMSDRTVLRDTIKGNKALADTLLAQGKITQNDYDIAMNSKAYGGTIRSLKKFPNGGTVGNQYRQSLQQVVNQPSIDNAALMDAEYTAALEAGQDKYKSSVTGLEYKVLPKAEKRLLAANLWKETHGSAPTKKQEEATMKAIEGKKVSSTKAKDVANIISNKWSELPEGNWKPKSNEKIIPENTWKNFAKSQGAQLLDAVGTAGFSAIGNPLYHNFGVDLTDYGIPHTKLDKESVDAKLSNPNEYADAASNAMLNIMGAKALGMAAPKIAGAMTPKTAPKYIANEFRDAELKAATYKKGKGSYTARQKQDNIKRRQHYKDEAQSHKLDFENTPEWKQQFTKKIVEKEDETLAIDLLNQKMNSLEIPSFQKLKLEQMAKDLQKAKNAGNQKEWSSIMSEIKNYTKSLDKKRSIKKK
jgi:hypothetical protein